MLQYSPKIVTDSLVMCLDASNNKSYPTDLPVKNGLVMWMDASDDTTFSYSSGTTVSQWRDKSGFNYHMVPVSAGPTRNAFLNSRKVLAFTTVQQIWNSSINLVTSAYTVFCVTRLSGTTPSRVLSTQYTGNTGGNWLLGHWGGYVNQYFAEGWIAYAAYAADNTWRMYMGDWGGPSNDIADAFSNGTSIRNQPSADASAGPLGLGINISSEVSTCEAAEIVVFNRLLSTTERKQVHTYLGQKWGISNTDRSIVDLAGNDDNGLFGNGTVANMPDYDFYNKGALTFNGTSDYINLGNASSIRMGTGNFTISTWVKILTQTGTPTFKLIITSKNAAAAAAGYGFAWNNSVNKFLWSTANGSSSSEIFTTNTWSSLEGVWANIVMIRQNGATNNGHFYINGVYESLASAATVLNVDTATNMTIANTADLNSSYWFKGLYGPVYIYNKALSAAEVLQNYEAQKSKFANTIVQQGLVLNLDAGNPYSYAGSGSVWYDVSGNANHATLYNSPTWNSSGYFSLNGTNNYIKTTSTLNLSTYNAVTVLVIFKARSYPVSGNVKFICELTTDFNSFQTGFVWTYNDTSLSQNYEVFTSVKGDAGYNIGVWNKNNYNDLNWEIGTAVFDKSQSSTETSLYNQGVLANVISNPAAGAALNNANNFGNDYLFIGCRGGSSYFTDLDVASILVYNRALSAAEILQNYNAMKGRFGL